MSRDPTHDALRELLAAEALHPSGGAREEAVRAHAAGCAACAAELASYRGAAAQLVFLAPEEPMQPAREQRVRQRLVARAKADRAEESPRPSEP